MLKLSAKEFRRGRITCLFFKCCLPRLLPRSYSIPVISVALIFANYCKTHDVVWFPFTTRIATGLKMISPQCLPVPPLSFSHLKMKRWKDGLALETHLPGLCLVQASWPGNVPWHLWVWWSPLHSGGNYTHLVVSLGVRAAMESRWHIAHARPLQPLSLERRPFSSILFSFIRGMTQVLTEDLIQRSHGYFLVSFIDLGGEKWVWWKFFQ